jgi:hypothetical protein
MPILLMKQRYCTDRMHSVCPPSERQKMATVKEEDNCDAPPQTSTPEAYAVSAGTNGQQAVPSGQVRGIPTA